MLIYIYIHTAGHFGLLRWHSSQKDPHVLDYVRHCWALRRALNIFVRACSVRAPDHFYVQRPSPHVEAFCDQLVSWSTCFKFVSTSRQGASIDPFNGQRHRASGFRGAAGLRGKGCGLGGVGAVGGGGARSSDGANDQTIERYASHLGM